MAAEKAVGPDRWVAMEVPSQWDRKRSLRFYMVVFEAADPDWSAPPFERPAVDGYIVYQVTKKDDGGFWMAALWSVATDDAEIARREAHKWGSLGAWKRVPDVVGLTLLETATWCMESGSAGPTGALRRLLGRG